MCKDEMKKRYHEKLYEEFLLIERNTERNGNYFTKFISNLPYEIKFFLIFFYRFMQRVSVIKKRKE